MSLKNTYSERKTLLIRIKRDFEEDPEYYDHLSMPSIMSPEDIKEDESNSKEIPKNLDPIKELRGSSPSKQRSRRSISSMSNRTITPDILQKHISTSSARDSKQQQDTAYANIERFRSNSLKFQSLSLSNNEQKMIVTLEVQSRTLPLFLRMLKAFVLFCRMYLLISPSLISNLKSFEGNELIYHVNLIFSAIIFVKINLVLKKKRRQYFRSITQCADYISCLGLVLSSLIYTLTSHFIHARNSFQHYYFWSFCCFVNIFHIIDRLKQFRLISETFSIIMLAVKLNYPFFYVMLIVYCVFASLGSYIFGGCIHSDTPAQMNAVGHTINPLLVIHNWNDCLGLSTRHQC